MILTQQPDGSLATSPSFAGVDMTSPCAEDSHDWREESKIPKGITEQPVHTNTASYQKCSKCRWLRVVYSKE